MENKRGAIGSEPAGPSPADRRDFLKLCGRYAAVTPPMVTLLLSTAGPNYALAASGRAAADGDEPGAAEARLIARLPPRPPIQPVSVKRIEPIGAGNSLIRAPGPANSCKVF